MKQLARTTIGGKVLRAAYESHFEAAGGYERMFRGLYPDFKSAAAAAPPGKQIGYNGDATTTRRAHEWRYIFPSDYPVLFWLDRLLPETKMLFDLGGDIGSRYLAFRKLLTYPDNFTWLVNDIPSIVALGRTIAQEDGGAPSAVHHQLHALGRGRHPTRVGRAAGVGGLERFPAAGSFLATSYPDQPNARRRPIGGSYAIRYRRLVHAYRIFSRQSFITAFADLGYRLVDEWLTPGFDCRIPDHVYHSLEAFSGFYFVLEPSGPRERPLQRQSSAIFLGRRPN